MAHLWDDDPYQEKSWTRFAIVYAGQTAQRVRKHTRRIAVASAALFALYCALSYVFGGTAVDRDVVANSAYAARSPHNVALYRWHDNVSDAFVRQSVVDARRALAHSNMLALVATVHSDENALAAPVNCFDLLSTNAETARFYSQLLHDAVVYLSANALEHSTCVCAPMLGHALRYLALGALRTGEPGDEPVFVEHLFNPLDQHAEQYDALDAAFLEQSGVDLSVEHESENYRYNEPRGNYSVLRRQKVVIKLLDKTCHARQLTARGALAVCAQRCFDMMRGIDVRARARMQHARGVRLNDALFGAIPLPTAPAATKRAAIARDEL